MEHLNPPVIGKFDQSFDEIKVGGRFIGQIIRKGEVIDEFEFDNLVVNEGLNYALNAAFGQAGALSSWYVALFEGNFTPSAGNTAATIASLSTECTAYAASTRPAWTVVPSTNNQLTNSASRASFVFNASKTLYGAFLISNSTKSGVTGTLFSAARFTTPKNVDADDELLLTYVLNASSL